VTRCGDSRNLADERRQDPLWRSPARKVVILFIRQWTMIPSAPPDASKPADIPTMKE
jgi:hypothetical protein